ncbi:unnamed protein product, partial [Mesorhabditis spiculigera]
MGASESKVSVLNGTGQTIRVRVDCSRSFTKCLAIETSAKLKSAQGSVKCEEQYDVFHIVDTHPSFTILATGAETVFELPADDNDFAFLTVWRENADGSWSVQAENHPIMTLGAVMVSDNIFAEQARHMKDAIANIGPIKEAKAGRIVVFNNCSKKIWVRVDADGIEKTKTTYAQSVGGCGREHALKYSTERKVYYRAEQGKGYTLVCTNGATVFYLDSRAQRVFYLSIDFETPSGKLATHCVSHALRSFDAKQVTSPWKGVGNMSHPVNDYHTPYVFVSDENSTGGVKFECRLEQPLTQQGGL